MGGGGNVSSLSATITSAGNSISFTGLTKEPSKFLMILTGGSVYTARGEYPLIYARYDGTDLYMQFGSSSQYSSNVALSTGTSTDYTFTYSNGVLTINTNVGHIVPGTYTLYYTI